MNERIEKLFDQALEKFKAENQYAIIVVPDSLQRDFVAKFAQLIIQECMQQVEEQYKTVLEDKEMMKDTHWKGYVQCGIDSYVAIREHFFGVEE